MIFLITSRPGFSSIFLKGDNICDFLFAQWIKGYILKDFAPGDANCSI